MPVTKGSKRQYFPKVKEAREALKERALQILEDYMDVIAQAKEFGDYKTAAESLQWLIEHLPRDEGQGIIDVSVDKPKESNQKTVPTIQIGFALGGIKAPKELPPAVVIEEEPEDE